MLRLPTRQFPTPTPSICRQCLHRIQVTRLNSARTARLPLALRLFHNEPARREELVPIRKQLKDEAKKKKLDGSGKALKSKKLGKRNPQPEKWELTVGIEIHAELNTARKLFSSAAASTMSDTPNKHTALFDLAFPGSQPQFQKETLLPAIRAAIALNCSIQQRSTFDRKHYFYQDQPAGYQITQYYEPFAKDGSITLFAHDGIDPEDGDSVKIGIKQIQMEQDTAKTLQQPPSTHLLDFNRVSHPLIEIISLPQIHSPITAAAYVRKIQSILNSIDAVTAGMEVGGMRADVNVSVRPRNATDDSKSQNSYYGVVGLGQRTEIKNISSTKAVEEAIIAERDRQISVLEAGGTIESETRGWTLGSMETTSLRSKEGEVDYRYMPDPDIGPVLIDSALVEHLKITLPQLPEEILDTLVANPEFGLTMKDAKTLISLDDGDRLEYFLEVVSQLRAEFPNDADILAKIGKTANNWVLHELGGLLTSSTTRWSPTLVPAQHLSSIISHLLRRQITGRTAKYLLTRLFAHSISESASVDPSLSSEAPPTPSSIIEAENLLLHPMTDAEYAALAEEVVAGNAKMAEQVRDLKAKGAKGWEGKVMWFVGQMVRVGQEGRVEADRAGVAARKALFGEK